MVQDNPVRVAVIGCGFYGQNHLHSWNDLRTRGGEFMAVCDLSPDKARTAGEKFGVAWYTDVNEMLDSHEIDLVDIATQMRSHRVLAATAAERGIGAIVQKPLAPNLAECVAIVEKARQHDAWLAVHENFRYRTAMVRAKEIIDSGAIGTPDWARISWRTGHDVYAGQPYLAREERFSILDVGIHVLDLARFFFGEVERVFCEAQQRKSGLAGEDTATYLLRHKSGTVSVVENTYQSRRSPDMFPETRLEIEGAKGSIITSPGETMVVTTNGDSRSETVGAPLLSWTTRPRHVSQEAVLNTNAHCLEAFRLGKDADTSGEDNLKTFALVEAAYESAAKHIAVKPEYS